MWWWPERGIRLPGSAASANQREGLKAFLILAAFTLITRGWIFGNPVVNMDEHQDQLHPVDQMLFKLGIDPNLIPAEEKVVRPNFTQTEMGSLSRFMQMKKQIGLYQLSAANPVRCLPVNDSAFMLVKLAQETPDIHWLAPYDEFVPADYHKALLCPTCNGNGTVQQTVASPVAVSGTVATDGTTASPAPAVLATCPNCNGHKYRAPNIEPFCAPNLRELRPDAPEALADIVARLLAKRPEARPADADTLAQALQALRQS